MGSEPCLGRRRGTIIALAFFIVLGLMAEALFPAIVEAKPKRDHRVHAQVIGGEAVAQGQLTFMAFIEVETEDGVFLCGGTLIDPSFVLTAAHCVVDDVGGVIDADAFFLTIGAADLNDFEHGVDRSVLEVTPHPAYDPISFANDVALLELDAPVPSDVAQPVRLVDSGQSSLDQEGKDALVAGWGVTESGNTSDRLLEATIKLVNSGECSAAYVEFQPSTMLCAAFPARDSCFGDSGGPLIVKEQIGTKKAKSKKEKHKKGKHHKHKSKHKKRKPIFTDVQSGIVSFGGEFCADPDFPGVYTKLSAPQIRDFVTGVINS